MKLVATGAGVAVAALVGLIASVAGYPSPFPVAQIALIAASVAAAIVAATVGSGRALPPWSLMATLSLALGVGSFMLWPRPPTLINYLAPALALAAATLAGIAAVAWGSRRRSQPSPPSLATWRIALISTSAVAMSVVGLLTLASLNPFGLGFLTSAGLMGAAAVRAIASSSRRVVATIAVLATAPVPILIAVGALIVTEQVADRRYYLPASYRGWVAIELENPACPAPVRSGTEFVYRVDDRGCGCTSTSGPKGFGRWVFVAVSPDGSVTELPYRGNNQDDLIWKPHSGIDSTRRYPYEAFFVGSPAEFQATSPMQTRQQVERCLLPR